jgi:hypothetical protein
MEHGRTCPKRLAAVAFCGRRATTPRNTRAHAFPHRPAICAVALWVKNDHLHERRLIGRRAADRRLSSEVTRDATIVSEAAASLR